MMHLSRAALSAMLVSLAAASAAAAPGASEWAPGLHAAFRLVDGGPAGASHRAGVEIKLDPHFKTYWRTPGESGLPPSFDWSGSQNVRSVTVRWPMPERFSDGGGSSIGYKGGVLLPLEVVPAELGQPVTLDLKLDYAVCEQICIPVRGEARLALGGPLVPFASAVRDADEKAPVRAPLAGGKPPAVAALAAAADDAALLATTLAPADAPGVELLAEGPTPDWLFGAPLRVSETTEGGVRRTAWRLAVEARPPGARLAGGTVTVTLGAGGAAVEVVHRLDAEVKPH